MTYEEIVNVVADCIFIGKGMDDYDKGELSGTAFVIARMFDKKKSNVKADIRNAYERRTAEE